jgi:adenylate kinase family enzyme
VLRERVTAATEGDDWVTDSTYHSMLGNLVPDRADVLVWLDLPARVIMWRLLRRTHRRISQRTVLWNGNVEAGWRDAVRYLLWPALTRTFENRREFPSRYAHFDMRRLRSDSDVREFVQSIQATSSTSGSSGSIDRQKTPPLTET